MHRRTLLAVPAALALAAAAPPPAWRHDVSEIRYGATGPGTARRARALARHLGVPVRAVALPPRALAAAMNAGHLECASLGVALAPVQALMGDRLLPMGEAALRRSLPPALRHDLAAALTATA